jgi:hypothetical protein
LPHRKYTKSIFFLSTEGELEAEWLQAAGLGSLATPFQAGLEVTEAQLGEAVRPLPREQAAAVRRRVRKLNRTVRRKRAASRAKKPDIRDVFRDLEVRQLELVFFLSCHGDLRIIST